MVCSSDSFMDTNWMEIFDITIRAFMAHRNANLLCVHCHITKDFKLSVAIQNIELVREYIS